MFRNLIEIFLKKNKNKIPEPDYVNYEDKNISHLNNASLITRKEENDNELLEKVS